jgi:hypothetical protein
MDPSILTPIVIILGKYALDKGVELGKSAGPKALETAKEMYALTLDHLRRKPMSEVITDEFEEDPVTYQKPMEKELKQVAEADPAFKAKLATLYQQFEAAAKEHVAAKNADYKSVITGSGAVAQGPGAVAAGAGGVAVGGNVEGNITVRSNAEDKDQ